MHKMGWFGWLGALKIMGNAGADLGFYKGGCPIRLKGAPEEKIFFKNFRPPIILTHVTETKQFFGP